MHLAIHADNFAGCNVALIFSFTVLLFSHGKWTYTQHKIDLGIIFVFCVEKSEKLLFKKFICFFPRHLNNNRFSNNVVGCCFLATKNPFKYTLFAPRLFLARDKRFRFLVKRLDRPSICLNDCASLLGLVGIFLDNFVILLGWLRICILSESSCMKILEILKFLLGKVTESFPYFSQLSNFFV